MQDGVSVGSGDGKTRQRASSMCETLVIIQLLHTDHTEKPQTRRTDRQAEESRCEHGDGTRQMHPEVQGSGGTTSKSQPK